MNAPVFLRFVPRRGQTDLTARVKALAPEHGLAVVSVTGSDAFDGLSEVLESHIEHGHVDGFDWFTSERARVSTDPTNLMPGVRSIVSVGVPYWSGALEKPADVPRGRIARYAWGADYHDILKQRMRGFLSAIERIAGRSVEARLLVDTARIVDRAVAARSGLGWYGKQSCIIVPGHGTWVMLGELLLDIDLDTDEPISKDCGRCSICIDRCPTGAIVGPYVVDSPRCLSFQTIEQRGAIPRELRPLMGDWVFGCDVCQDVCPYTAAARVVDDPAFRPPSIDRVFPSLRDLIAMSEQSFRETFRGSAVIRAKRRGMARNAAVALGNVGSEDDVPYLAAQLSQHDEPLVRGHVAWALGRIGGAQAREVLERCLEPQRDSSVRAEIRAALESL